MGICYEALGFYYKITSRFFHHHVERWCEVLVQLLDWSCEIHALVPAEPWNLLSGLVLLTQSQPHLPRRVSLTIKAGKNEEYKCLD